MSEHPSERPDKKIENIDDLLQRVRGGSMEAAAFLKKLESYGFDTTGTDRRHMAKNVDEFFNQHRTLEERKEEMPHDQYEYRVGQNYQNGKQVWVLRKYERGFSEEQKNRRLQNEAYRNQMRRKGIRGKRYLEARDEARLREGGPVPLVPEQFKRLGVYSSGFIDQVELLSPEEQEKLATQDRAARQEKHDQAKQTHQQEQTAVTRSYYRQTPGAFRNWSAKDKVKLMGNDVTEADIDRGLKEGYYDATGTDAIAKVEKMTRDGTIDKMVEEHMRQALSGKPIEGTSSEAVERWQKFEDATKAVSLDLQPITDKTLRAGLKGLYAHELGGTLKPEEVSFLINAITRKFVSATPKEQEAVRQIVEKWPLTTMQGKLPDVVKPSADPAGSPDEQSHWGKDEIAQYLDSIEKDEGLKNRFIHGVEFTLEEMENGISQGPWREGLEATLQKIKPDERFNYFSEVQGRLQRSPTAVWQVSQVGDGDTYVLRNKKNNMAVRFEKMWSDKPTVILALPPNPGEREQFGLERWNAQLEVVPAAIKGEVEGDFKDIKSNALRADLLTLLIHEQQWDQELTQDRLRYYIDSVRDAYIHASPEDQRAVKALLQKRAINALNGQLV